MREGEAIAAFANGFQGLILASIDPDNEHIKYHFIHKLPNEVQTLRAFDMYEEEKSFSRKCRASPPRDPREDREADEDEHATKSSVFVHSKRTSQQ